MKFLVSLFVALAAGVVNAANPIFRGWYADPEAVIYGDTYWIFPTSSLPFEEQTYMDAFSSKDLKTWTKHPRIITSDNVKWAKRAMWAPASIEKDGKYYLFFSANDVHEGEIGGIGVAVADKPEGPYKDHIGRPLINEIVWETLLPTDKPGRTGAQPIDQFVFRDDDGRYYMYYGGWGHCILVALADDFKSVVPLPDGKMFREVTPDNYTEGPFMFKRNGKYYFMWSEGNWTKANYFVNYAISDSPFGPFESKGRILEADGKLGTGAGHHSVINIPGTDDYYIVYHMHPAGDTDGNHREIAIDRMEFDSKGNILPVKITKKGVAPRHIGHTALTLRNGKLGKEWKTATAVTDKEEYLRELMSKMTIDEKLGQLNLPAYGDIVTGTPTDNNADDLITRGLVGGVFNIKGAKKIRELQEKAIEKSRLGIPLFIGMDVIHGYQTTFPIPLALSCTWDMDGIENSAHVAAHEASAAGINWVYSPMVDISRDPRWGRVAEGAGEDPYLGSQVAKAMVRGYQGDYTADDNVMACVKHFALYGASDAGRDYNTVDMSRLRMYNEYLDPYKAAVEAGVGSVMSSFNLVDGKHATANKWLLTDLLRNLWGFDGFVVTDYNSIGEMKTHGFGDDYSNAVSAFNAGTDMDMVSHLLLDQLKTALDKGDVTIADIDRAVYRVLDAKYKLGLFLFSYKYNDIAKESTEIYTQAHRDAARDMARKSFVLLKNDNSLLPLAKKGKIALIGPLADAGTNMAGTWAVGADISGFKSLLDGFREALGDKAEVLYAKGSNIVSDAHQEEGATADGMAIRDSRSDAEMLREALDIAAKADVIVAALGEGGQHSGEGSSRSQIGLPDVQMTLLEALVKTGKPIVLLNFSGRPTVMTRESETIPAIMNVWFGGSEAADAIADVVFGDKAPSGKLTMSIPYNEGQIPVYYNHMNTGRPVKNDIGLYRRYASNYFEIPNHPLYPFGYGLSYTTFDYSDPVLSATSMEQDGSIEVSFNVTNTGNMEADEIAQLYIHDTVRSIAPPVMELKGFERFSLQPGESRQVTFKITPEMLKFYNYDLEFVAEPGDFEVLVGPSSDNLKSASFTLR